MLKEKVTSTFNDSGEKIREVVEETNIKKDQEPDYIKIYTAMFFEFKGFPVKYRELFLQLAVRMTYCSGKNPDASQIVCVSGVIKKEIMEACGWSNGSPLVRGLKDLCDCGAIRRVGRGLYQINPEYAAKGAWQYSERLGKGGVKDLVTIFRLKNQDFDVIPLDSDDNYDVPDNVIVGHPASDPVIQELTSLLCGSDNGNKDSLAPDGKKFDSKGRLY